MTNMGDHFSWALQAPPAWGFLCAQQTSSRKKDLRGHIFVGVVPAGCCARPRERIWEEAEREPTAQQAPLWLWKSGLVPGSLIIA